VFLVGEGLWRFAFPESVDVDAGFIRRELSLSGYTPEGFRESGMTA
jgi:hypothetical protein